MRKARNMAYKKNLPFGTPTLPAEKMKHAEGKWRNQKYKNISFSKTHKKIRCSLK